MNNTSRVQLELMLVDAPGPHTSVKSPWFSWNWNGTLSPGVWLRWRIIKQTLATNKPTNNSR